MNLIEKKKNKKTRKILIMMVCFVPLMGLKALAVVDTSGLENAKNEFISILQVIGGILLGVTFAVALIASIGGARQGREWAKPTMMWSALGFLALMNVDDLVNFIKDLSKMI